MESYLDRLRTFYSIERRGFITIIKKIYPSNAQKPCDLAGAGFFYEGDADTVRCIRCCIRLMEWTEEDCPIEIHRTIVPTCPFFLTG